MIRSICHIIWIIFLFYSFNYHASRQINSIYGDTLFIKKRIIFYNVENLFHPSDDSVKNDDDFTPSGFYHWNYRRYQEKLNKLAQVLISLGEGEKPAIIGFCEIENRRVLEDLNSKTILKYFSYRIIHQESDDPRGIDVGLLYDPEIFIPENYTSISIINEDSSKMLTRDILSVTGSFFGKFRCHMFVNHWPSRRGGQKASEQKRVTVASHLRQQVDLILDEEKDANIFIFGDFNDEPVDKSLHRILRALDYEMGVTRAGDLFNLMFHHYKKGNGTYYRKNNFIESSVIDQFIVSRALMEGKNGIKIKNNAGEIFKNDFLIDEKNGKPLRTFQGLKYIGGFSDHFPVFIEIFFTDDNK